jgi:soluble lytic murein transglycosylase-like protein/tetratricopeptide (TPR) repeat protein
MSASPRGEAGRYGSHWRARRQLLGVGVALVFPLRPAGSGTAAAVDPTPDAVGVTTNLLARSSAAQSRNLDIAREALRDGDYRNAYLSFRNAFRDGSNESERSTALLGACEALLADRLPDEAIDPLGEWIDTYPAHPGQYVARIMLARATQDSIRPSVSTSALRAWREVLYVGAIPCADAVRVKSATLLRSLGQSDQAVAELKSALVEVTGPGASHAARLLVADALRRLAMDTRDSSLVNALADEILDAITKVGRLPDDVAEAAWRVVSAAVASGDTGRADMLRWQIIGEWPETPIAWQAMIELGANQIPAMSRAIIAAANGKWETVREATRWLLENASGNPEVGQARALRGIAANALAEPDADRLLDEGSVPEAGSRWGARAIWEAAERRRAANDLSGAVARYERLTSFFPSTLQAGQGNYQLGRILPSTGDLRRATEAMNLAADVGPVGFHTVRARQILRRKPLSAPKRTESFVASGVISRGEWADWETWLANHGLFSALTSGDLDAPDLQVAVGRLDALLASGLLAEAEDAAREICQRRAYGPAVLANVADRLRRGGHLPFSMTLGHRLLRVLDAAGESSTFGLPSVARKLAYPLAYARLVADSAAREGIDPYLLLALMKQESWFNPNAESKANARGLTQFIRPTAVAIAGELKWPNWKWDDLFRPYVAVPFGARYLASLLRDFKGNALYATAAYNAGPGPVIRWIGGDWERDPDQFVAAVTYRETREYVKNIATYAEVYRDTYGV